MTDTPIFRAAVKAYCADYIDRLFADLRAAVGMTNPLTLDLGDYCAACDALLRYDNYGGVASRCPVCGERR